ncbi:uncharacterized protein TNCV_4686321 [Trichonephila clavipes]|nr:uncharacterized protein TNCV_4686321 [Trichonephila clavipes]
MRSRLLPSMILNARASGDEFILIGDYVLPHRARHVKEFLEVPCLKTSMDFDRHRSRQKSAPGSDNDAKYYFSDVGDGGRSKAAKQLRRRKNLDDTDAKDGHKDKGFSSDKRELKYQRPDEKEKNFPDQFQLRSGKSH